MEQEQLKRWYQKWWGWVILICFWWIAAPIAIYQSRLNQKTKKIAYGVYGFFIVIIIIGMFTADKTEAPLSETKNKVSEKNEVKKQEKATNDEGDKKEVKRKVDTEKKRIKEEFQKYENGHLKLWNEMTDSMQNGDVYSAYGYAEKAKGAVIGINIEMNNLKCNKTGDIEFDKQCKETLELGKEAYLMKQEALNDLLKWFDDLQSPKKANEAKKTLEEGGKYWQDFILKLAALTITDEDIKNVKK